MIQRNLNWNNYLNKKYFLNNEMLFHSLQMELIFLLTSNRFTLKKFFFWDELYPAYDQQQHLVWNSHKFLKFLKLWDAFKKLFLGIETLIYNIYYSPYYYLMILALKKYSNCNTRDILRICLKKFCESHHWFSKPVFWFNCFFVQDLRQNLETS
jgi:hypothetical protein